MAGGGCRPVRRVCLGPNVLFPASCSRQGPVSGRACQPDDADRRGPPARNGCRRVATQQPPAILDDAPAKRASFRDRRRKGVREWPRRGAKVFRKRQRLILSGILARANGERRAAIRHAREPDGLLSARASIKTTSGVVHQRDIERPISVECVRSDLEVVAEIDVHAHPLRRLSLPSRSTVVRAPAACRARFRSSRAARTLPSDMIGDHP